MMEKTPRARAKLSMRIKAFATGNESKSQLVKSGSDYDQILLFSFPSIFN